MEIYTSPHSTKRVKKYILLRQSMDSILCRVLYSVDQLELTLRAGHHSCMPLQVVRLVELSVTKRERTLLTYLPHSRVNHAHLKRGQECLLMYQYTQKLLF